MRGPEQGERIDAAAKLLPLITTMQVEGASLRIGTIHARDSRRNTAQLGRIGDGGEMRQQPGLRRP